MSKLLENFWRRTRLIAEACLKREGLAFLAFLLSAGAGPVLCLMLFWAMQRLAGAEQWDAIANLAYGLLLTVALLMWSIHRLLGSKQAIELEFWKLKAKLSQGDE
jgi:hypothetical protein